MPAETVLIPGGEFTMGSDRHYPEEAPAHRVRVGAFRLELHPVTNEHFARFVAATGYRTVAERELAEAEYPQLSVDERAPGSLVFRETAGPVDLRNWRAWWQWVPGASWRNPSGPDSTVDGLEHHPVVHVCHADALAYCAWAGRRLPTEAEWERAAGGGRSEHGALDYAWGQELAPGGRLQANTWQGDFPYRNTGALGYLRTSPVGTFPANEYGLLDVIGNVWEWTSTRFTPNHRRAAGGHEPDETGRPACPCGPAGTPDPRSTRVVKGGSHLCAPEYCRRYRPAARSPQSEDSATSHMGFRCAVDA